MLLSTAHWCLERCKSALKDASDENNLKTLNKFETNRKTRNGKLTITKLAPQHAARTRPERERAPPILRVRMWAYPNAPPMPPATRQQTQPPGASILDRNQGVPLPFQGFFGVPDITVEL